VKLWSRAPLALKAYAVLAVAWPTASVVAGIGTLWVQLVGIPLSALIAYFLLRGVRWLWWFVVVTSGLFLVQTTVEGGIAWYFMAGNLVTFVLLMLPQTRRHFFDREPAPVGGGTTA
jgi:predicted ABC-type sugar transport system permease subunit